MGRATDGRSWSIPCPAPWTPSGRSSWGRRPGERGTHSRMGRGNPVFRRWHRSGSAGHSSHTTAGPPHPIHHDHPPANTREPKPGEPSAIGWESRTAHRGQGPSGDERVPTRVGALSCGRPGRLAQRESAALTRRRSQVRNLERPPRGLHAVPCGPRRRRLGVCHPSQKSLLTGGSKGRRFGRGDRWDLRVPAVSIFAGVYRLLGPPPPSPSEGSAVSSDRRRSTSRRSASAVSSRSSGTSWPQLYVSMMGEPGCCCSRRPASGPRCRSTPTPHTGQRLPSELSATTADPRLPCAPSPARACRAPARPRGPRWTRTRRCPLGCRPRRASTRWPGPRRRARGCPRAARPSGRGGA